VLGREGGALPKIVAPVRLGLGAALGNGQQWMSWIHIDDLCRMFVEALEDSSWHGVYNAVTAEPVTNSALTRQIAKVLSRPLWLPPVPSFTLQLIFGEMADVILGSNLVLNERIASQTTFKYKFEDIRTAVEDLLK